MDGPVIDAGLEAGQPMGLDGGYVLARQSKLTGNSVIEIVVADEIVIHPARMIKGTVFREDSPTHEIRHLRSRRAKPLEFPPGLCATLQVSPEHFRAR